MGYRSLGADAKMLSNTMKMWSTSMSNIPYGQHYQQDQYHEQQHDHQQRYEQCYEQDQHQYPGHQQTCIPLTHTYAHVHPHERYTPAEQSAHPAKPVQPTFEIHAPSEADMSPSGHPTPYEYEHSNNFAVGTGKGTNVRFGDTQRKEVFLQVPSRIRMGEGLKSRKFGSAGRVAVL